MSYGHDTPDNIWRCAKTFSQLFILGAVLVFALFSELGYTPRYRQTSDRPFGKEFMQAAKGSL